MKFKYDEIVNKNIKRIKHPLNEFKKEKDNEFPKIIEKIIAKIKNKLSKEIDIFKNKFDQYLLESNNFRKNLKLFFELAGKGGEGNETKQKISLPVLSKWNIKWSNKDLYAQSRMLVSIYVPLIMNKENEYSYEYDKIIYLVVKDSDVMNRTESSNESNRWVETIDILEIYERDN